jgi:hypothetical protein
MKVKTATSIVVIRKRSIGMSTIVGVAKVVIPVLKTLSVTGQTLSVKTGMSK